MPARATATTAMRGVLAAGALALALAACGGTKEEAYVERPVEELYNDGMNRIAEGSYRDAAKKFDEVERQHPYSVWATKAQLMAAFAHYENSRYDDAIVALDRFIQLHPGNRDIAYAYYLKGLCYYEQITDVQRDQRNTDRALASLQEVVRRYPDSRYARDAKLKIDLTHDHLAGKEMAIGRYYLRQGNYLAAINRFRVVVEKYQTTSQAPEALHRLTEAYLALGITAEAQTAAAVLGHNFPGSDWYTDSYRMLTGKDLAPKKDEGSWISRVWGSIF
ncbi:outer membrane protein assembly factor BamD [Allostella humosa]|nr:outer membrane protein assembly factor BamD [Stella humosa]